MNNNDFNNFDIDFRVSEAPVQKKKAPRDFVDFSLNDKVELEDAPTNIPVKNIKIETENIEISDELQNSNDTLKDENILLELDISENDISLDDSMFSVRSSKSYSKKQSNENITDTEIEHSVIKESDLNNSDKSNIEYTYDDSSDVSSSISDENISDGASVKDESNDSKNNLEENISKGTAFPGAKNVEPMTYVPKVHLEDISDSPVASNSDVAVDTVNWSSKVNFSNSYTQRAKASMNDSSDETKSKQPSHQSDDLYEVKFCNFAMMAKVKKDTTKNNVKKK